jgi:hypothetical protein|tara:strand:+ start:2028 stop:2477 length:450 start_codon:yes stop_codon:yes gene_type:complete
MASTLTPTTFKVKIKEEHVVRNISTLYENIVEIKNVTNVDRRIVTIPHTSSVDLININGVVPGAGTFPSSSIQYARITNLDNSSSLAVTFSSSRDEYWSQKLNPTTSLVWSGAEVSGSSFNGTLSSDLTSIKVYPMSSSIDVEYVIVNA